MQEGWWHRGGLFALLAGYGVVGVGVGGKVGGEHTTASLDGITAFPDHGANWSAAHVCILLDNVYGE